MTPGDLLRWKTPILPLSRSTSDALPHLELSAEIRSDDLEAGRDPLAYGFANWADIDVPLLADLPARTDGRFSELVIDILAPLFPERPDYLYEVDLRLDDACLETKTFRNFTQRHQFFIPCHKFLTPTTVVSLSARMISGGADAPRFFVRVHYGSYKHLIESMMHDFIWLFSTARSGSTWLSHDLLCWDDNTRPMDEPGIGKMFAPLDWAAERFDRLPEKNFHFESGLAYETGRRLRASGSDLPPFERVFIYAKQENQIWNPQNWRMFLDIVRETTVRHVINEWGVIGYRKTVFKMPNDSHGADIIMEAFPQSFMIVLIRDGRDVMRSRFSPFASRTLAETTDAALLLNAVAFYSHFWNFQMDIMLSAFEAHAPERRLLVHYEKLRAAPLDTAREIFDRTGIPISDADLAALIEQTTLENFPESERGPDKPRQTGLIGKYASTFTMQEIRLMDEIMGSNLRRFGYALHQGTPAG